MMMMMMMNADTHTQMQLITVNTSFKHLIVQLVFLYWARIKYTTQVPRPV